MTRVPLFNGRPSVHLAVGMAASGKTHLLLYLIEDARAGNGWPTLLIDSSGVENITHWNHADSVDEAIRRVWVRGEDCAFKPSREQDVLKLVDASVAAGCVNLAIDESHHWLNARTWGDHPIIRAARMHRHAGGPGRGMTLIMTSQHFTGDVPAALVSCGVTWYVFRSTAPAALSRLAGMGLDPDVIKGLPQGRFVRHRDSF